jgi:hypothetical protein
MFKFTEQKYKFMKAYCESLRDFSNDLVLRLLRRLKKGEERLWKNGTGSTESRDI